MSPVCGSVASDRMSSYSCWRSSVSPLIATRCSANQSPASSSASRSIFSRSGLHGGERRRPHVRLPQVFVVLVGRVDEVVDVALRDVGAEHALRLVQRRSGSPGRPRRTSASVYVTPVCPLVPVSVWMCTAQISSTAARDLVGVHRRVPVEPVVQLRGRLGERRRAGARRPTAPARARRVASPASTRAAGTACVGSASNAAHTSSADRRVRLELASVDQDPAHRRSAGARRSGRSCTSRRSRRSSDRSTAGCSRPRSVVVAGDAARQRAADHPAEELRDVRLVFGRAETDEHLGARTVPPGRDRLLRDEHAHVGRLLNPLRLDPVDLPSRRTSPSCSPVRTWRTDSAVEVGNHRVDRVERARRPRR